MLERRCAGFNCLCERGTVVWTNAIHVDREGAKLQELVDEEHASAMKTWCACLIYGLDAEVVKGDAQGEPRRIGMRGVGQFIFEANMHHADVYLRALAERKSSQKYLNIVHDRGNKFASKGGGFLFILGFVFDLFTYGVQCLNCFLAQRIFSSLDTIMIFFAETLGREHKENLVYLGAHWL